jgi:hypothetical protein
MLNKIRLIFLGCLLAGAVNTASAADCLWTGGSAAPTALWSDPLNWTNCGGLHPHAADTATLPDGAARPDTIYNITTDGPQTVTILGRAAGNVAWSVTVQGAKFQLKSLTVTSPPDALNHGPSFIGAIDLADQATVTTHMAAGGTSTLTLGTPNVDIFLSGHTLTFNLDAPVVVLGDIRDNCPGQLNALVKTGPSELILNTDGYCGATVIDAGSVTANSSTSLGLALDDLIALPPAGNGVRANDLASGTDLTQVMANGRLELANNVAISDTINLLGTYSVPLGAEASTDNVRYAAGARIAMDGQLRIDGRLSALNDPARLTVAGGRLVLNGIVAFHLNGTDAGTSYEQLDLTSGGIDLTAGSTLELTRGFDVPPGTQFTLINVAPGKSVTGTFGNVIEGGTLTINNQKFSISYHGGDGNDVVLTAVDDGPKLTYYLSEGSTGPFFDTDVLIANPNLADAPITVIFSKEDGSQLQTTRTVAARSRMTLHLDQLDGLQGTAVSTQVRSDNNLPLVVERTMFWDQSYYAGSTGSSVDKPGTDWYFAEGSQGFFQTFLLVINPNPTPTDVTFTFFRELDGPITRTITVGATTRLTLDAGSVPELINRSFGTTVHATLPIMAERAMYFGTTATRLWSGGTESSGVPAPSTHWFLAEGATGGFFDTFVEVSNPTSQDAQATFQYLLPTGETISVPKVIAAHSRLTTNLETEDDVRLHNTAVSTVVTSDVPVVAERSMYWPGAAIPWGEGHDSFGVVDAGLNWGLAEGRKGGSLNFHTYILLANPQAQAAEVTVVFVRENGAAPITKTYTVAATSRFNIDSSTIAELQDESFGALITVTNNVPIIVERSLYWDSNGFSFSGGTNATGIALTP